jgi:hypothetical protein
MEQRLGAPLSSRQVCLLARVPPDLIGKVRGRTLTRAARSVAAVLVSIARVSSNGDTGWTGCVHRGAT